MDMVDERLSKEHSEVEHMDMKDIDMVEDMTTEMDVVEREHESMVLARHWISDGAKRHQRTHKEWEELAKSECLEIHTTFVRLDSNYSILRRVKKSGEEGKNEIKYVWNELKP
jgi:hypothetical protein